jgi:hypothetical protein
MARKSTEAPHGIQLRGNLQLDLRVGDWPHSRFGLWLFEACSAATTPCYL